MKKMYLLLAMMLVLGLAGCGKSDKKEETTKEETSAVSEQDEIDVEEQLFSEVVKIELSNDNILVNGEKISKDPDAAVYAANDIIFYLENQGIEYGDGKKKDEHSQIEGDAHTVVHITEPGVYELTGTMDAGQIFVDLGDGTKNEEEAAAALILNEVDITCTVAPAILFYRTYECTADVEEDDAVMNVDTSAAGANLVLADGTKNKLYGSYVAEIYEECELNEEGTEVVDSKKLYKFDGAVYSRRSMNISGTGSLNVVAENEGIGSEMHLTINGGNINIKSGNDGINVNEENISVFTMNEGTLNIQVTGETGEGDGIDSNGWLIVNGGTVNSFSNAESRDSGVDADKGIYINGGTVVSTGNMPAEIADGKLTAMTFQSMEKLEPSKKYEVKNSEGDVVLSASLKNAFSILTVASEEIIAEDTYTLWLEDAELAAGFSGPLEMFGPGMKGGHLPMPEGMKPPKNRS